MFVNIRTEDGEWRTMQNTSQLFNVRTTKGTWEPRDHQRRNIVHEKSRGGWTALR